MSEFRDEFELIKDGDLTLLGLALCISLSSRVAQIISQRIFELRKL